MKQKIKIINLKYNKIIHKSQIFINKQSKIKIQKKISHKNNQKSKIKQKIKYKDHNHNNKYLIKKIYIHKSRIRYSNSKIIMTNLKIIYLCYHLIEMIKLKNKFEKKKYRYVIVLLYVFKTFIYRNIIILNFLLIILNLKGLIFQIMNKKKPLNKIK